MLMLCPICAGEFEMRDDLCPACACELVPSTLNEKAAVMTEDIEKTDLEFTELCRPRLHAVALLIKQTLEQNGVTVLIQGAHSISVIPSLALFGELRLLVARDQLEYARELYKAYFESDEGIDYITEE